MTPLFRLARGLARGLGRIGLAIVAVLGVLVVFVALIVATDGVDFGVVAWVATAAVTVGTGLWLTRKRSGGARLVRLLPTALALLLAASVCVPTVSTHRRVPAAPPGVASRSWGLSTGSRLAVYHYPPAPGSVRRPRPLLYLNGGPVRGISLLDHGFLRQLAAQGYDVYAYEEAGGGRSGLLPMSRYTITREVDDLGAFVDKLGRGPIDVLGFSSGAVVLTRALADPPVAARLHRAIIADPGPMDGPTSRIKGQEGQPNAKGIAPPPAGPRSTIVPRYAVGFGLMRLGLLRPDTGLIGQAEGVNAFTAADLGSDTASGYCARDAHRIPIEDSASNFSFSAAASLQVQQTIKDSPSIAPELGRSRTPAMLMIAECSAQIRQWATSILLDDPSVERTQLMPGVGHHMWNGLDDNDAHAFAVIDAFLRGRPAALPNYPTRADVPAFLGDGR